MLEFSFKSVACFDYECMECVDNNCVLWSVKTTFWSFLNHPAWFVETNEASIFPSIAFSIKRNTAKSVNEDLYTLSQTDFV